MLPKQNRSSVRIMLDVVSVVLGRNIEELVFLQNNTCKFFSSNVCGATYSNCMQHCCLAIALVMVSHKFQERLVGFTTWSVGMG